MDDSRFSTIASDPRYRLPGRKESRTAVDPRFQGLLTDQEFRRKASVDRYGRKIGPGGRKSQETQERIDSEGSTIDTAKKRSSQKQIVTESSDDVDSEEDNEVVNELAVKRDPAREGFSESSSEEESSEDEGSDAELELAEETAGQEQNEDIPMGEVARRIAVVNLDWDNIRAVDIMSVAASFIPTGARIESVTTFPSAFGKERLEREELEGPPREIFASSKRSFHVDSDGADDDESSEDDEKIKKRLLATQADDGKDFDTAKLRQYQLERLRYYYAVIECDGKATAKAIYDALDGREYLSTSNFFDLRFIPDDTVFDETPHDECFEVPSGYKPNDFRTEALTHSKVRLTWDDEDRTRKEVQKRAFSRAEIDENDLQAYIGTDDSDADSIASRMSVAEKRKVAKKAAQKDKMRAALGLDAQSARSSKRDVDEPVGDMQITFTSGLGTGKNGKSVFENEPQDEESTRARYIRKERERKQKRKEKNKVGHDAVAVKDDPAEPGEVETEAVNADRDGFDDPFFNDPAVAAKDQKAAKKATQLQKRQAREARDAEAESRRAELELLMAGNQDDDLRHFDMREIEKAKKREKRKGKKGKKTAALDNQVSDDFKLETQDPRFKALFDSHEYAIDPTNPRFKKTEGMDALLEEGRKKRKLRDVGEESVGKISKKKIKGDVELDGLVARLKNKGKKHRD